MDDLPVIMWLVIVTDVLMSTRIVVPEGYRSMRGLSERRILSRRY